MHNDYTHIPREVQLYPEPVGAPGVYVPPVMYDDEQLAQMRTLARQQYGLDEDNVSYFVRLNRILDWYSDVVDTVGTLTREQDRHWNQMAHEYERLTSPERTARRAA